jgi:ATP-dependent exoDNAse (exonuclease V) beta subunit
LKFDFDMHIDLPKAKQINTDLGRRYATPDGEIYPSITTVLSSQPEKKKAIAEWRARVGADEANKISQQAARRGTKLHNIMEKYILGDELDLSKEMPTTRDRFRIVKKCVDTNLQLVYATESAMYSDILRIAGTADLICEWNGKPTVVDFKTSIRQKTREQIHDYFLQATAYSIMFEEHTGIRTLDFAVLIVSDEGDFDVFEGKRNDYVADLIRVRDGYEQRVKKVLTELA